jgi:hypothetical protein
MPLTFMKAFGHSASDDIWRSRAGVKAARLTRATRLPILSPVQSPQAFVSIEKGAKRMFPSPGKSWFSTREGHRYGWEIALIIGIKFALLAALWFAFVAPWMHPANPPVNVVQQLYVPGEPAVTHD